MNKTAIKNFAIWARNKLIADVSYDARLIGITEDGIATVSYTHLDVYKRQEQRRRLEVLSEESCFEAAPAPLPSEAICKSCSSQSLEEALGQMCIRDRDQVRPGGIVAFVTSRYTMDSKNPDARKYLAQRAELLGAIRLKEAKRAVIYLI